MGQGYCPDATGHCYVHFAGPQPTHSNYKVVDTDFVTYSIVYGCGIYGKDLWFLTREAVVDDALINKMLETARSNLPTFDFTRMLPRNYQGDKCTYAQPVSASQFLQ